MSRDDLGRARAFLRRADHVGTAGRETPLGPLVLTPELPQRWDSNYLLVERDADTATILGGAESAFAAAGLAHRKLQVEDEAVGERLRAELPPEWLRQRLLVMALRRAPEREPDVSVVSEVDEQRLRPVRAAELARYPWSREPEVQRQLLDAKLLIARRVETRFFAVLEDGVPVSWADLYLADAVAQIEDVTTVESHRNRGLASAVVAAAIRKAREAGAELVFLLADEDDWPKELYRRLGFDPIGRNYDFVRPGGAGARPRRRTSGGGSGETGGSPAGSGQ
jgi:GNAT superfamily N-acetyltransferase